MKPSTKPVPVSVPAGFHTVTPALTVKDAEKAIGFYRRAFGVEERMRFMGPDEKSILHAEIKIGDSIIILVRNILRWDFAGRKLLEARP